MNRLFSISCDSFTQEDFNLCKSIEVPGIMITVNAVPYVRYL